MGNWFVIGRERRAKEPDYVSPILPLYVAGSNNQFRKLEGEAWTVISGPTSVTAGTAWTALHVLSDGTLLAGTHQYPAGNYGSVWAYDGSWTHIYTTPAAGANPEFFNCITSTSGDKIYAVCQFNGSSNIGTGTKTSMSNFVSPGGRCNLVIDRLDSVLLGYEHIFVDDLLYFNVPNTSAQIDTSNPANSFNKRGVGWEPNGSQFVLMYRKATTGNVAFAVGNVGSWSEAYESSIGWSGGGSGYNGQPILCRTNGDIYATGTHGSDNLFRRVSGTWSTLTMSRAAVLTQAGWYGGSLYAGQVTGVFGAVGYLTKITGDIQEDVDVSMGTNFTVHAVSQDKGM